MPKESKKPVVTKRLTRKNPYPTKKSVVKALEARTREGKKNNARTLYLEDQSLYRKALEFKVELPRAKRGKKSARLHRTLAVAPSLVVEKTAKSNRKIRKYVKKKPGRKTKYTTRELLIAALEDREKQGKYNFPGIIPITLYRSAQRFNVELPKKNNYTAIYYPGDLVKNQNPKDPDICGKIGKVLNSSEKEVRVNFGEEGRITRVYIKWVNLNMIKLYARNSSMPVETTKREVVLV